MTVAATVRCVMSLNASCRPPAMLTSSARGAVAYFSRATARALPAGDGGGQILLSHADVLVRVSKVGVVIGN
jgi:hypothetical protein